VKNVFLSGPQGSHEELSLLAEALSAEGIQVSRPDRILPGTGIDTSGEILSAIKRCDVFVALLDKSHSNVMLELGYALGSGKSVFLIRGESGEIPFAIASFPTLTIDRFDSRSIGQVVEWIKGATVRSRPAVPDFQSPLEMLRRMVDDESFLDEVEPRVFEECIARFFQEKGFHAELMSSRNDRGFDIEILDLSRGGAAVVETKKQNRNSRLSVTEVQRLVGAAVVARAQCAIVITCGGFTNSARYFANQSPIPVILLTIDELVDLTPEALTAYLDFKVKGTHQQAREGQQVID
jgi:Restriction endonuclease